MKATRQVGLEHQLQFQVPASKTVPALYPESPEFRAMPEVFATGFLVGLLEWACIQAVKPHLDWPADATERRQSPIRRTRPPTPPTRSRYGATSCTPPAAAGHGCWSRSSSARPPPR